MALRLQGKVVLITGTAGGQGQSAAMLFAGEGAKVVGCDIKEKEAKETVKMVKDAGGEMESLQPVDLSIGDQAGMWIDFAVRTYGRIDVLYNNAANPRMGNIEDMSEQDWRYTIKNELDIIYFVTHYAWPHLKKSQGVVINVGSISGLVALPTELTSDVAHAATKGGVIAMTRQLAVDGAPYGIRVNCISPGIISTPATDIISQDKKLAESIHKKIPLHRLGKPEEIASVALFLASVDSSYMTGANVVVDGGISVSKG